MDEILVSIVVPVYKTEKYLDCCMESILKQNYHPLQVILVDDESPDGAPAICDAYSEQYEHVMVIHKRNEGSAYARNDGVKAAQGKYVMFVDSDDCLEDEETVSRLVERAEKKQADIVTGAFRRFHDGKIFAVNSHSFREGEYTRTGTFRFEGFYQTGYMGYNWGKLYRRKFLIEHNIWSKPYPFTQDKAMNMECYVYEPVYTFISEPVYRYRINESSITFKYKENFADVWISIAVDFERFLKEKGMNPAYKDLAVWHLYYGSVYVIEQELRMEKGFGRACRALKKYVEREPVKRAMSGLAKGTYTKDMTGIGSKLMARTASFLLCIHGYALYVGSIVVLKKLMDIKRKLKG